MHDTLALLPHEPIHRRYHHNELTFSLVYAFTENFVLPLSHDEVVHGKGSLLAEDARRPLAAAREPALAATRTCGPTPARSSCSWAASSAEPAEWNHDAEPAVAPARATGARGRARPGPRPERALPRRARALGGRLRRRRASAGSSRTTPSTTCSRSCASRRTARACSSASRTSRRSRAQSYRLGLPRRGRWREVLNTDSVLYGGSGVGNLGAVEAEDEAVARPRRVGARHRAAARPSSGCEPDGAGLTRSGLARAAVPARPGLGRRRHELLDLLRARRARSSSASSTTPGTRSAIAVRERTAFNWHCYLPGVGPGQRYGYRVHGPYDPATGERFNPAKLLIDPYAKAIDGAGRLGRGELAAVRRRRRRGRRPRRSTTTDSAPADAEVAS